MRKPALKITEDNTDFFNQTIKSFKNDKVLVGIPVEENAREDQGPINNATLLAINNFGSPLNNTPPRPVMSIGIKKAQEPIAEQFKLAVVNTFTKGDKNAMDKYYERAGIIASNSIKKVINSQEGIKPPSEATLAARKAVGFLGKKALIVTAQMRNAITYVVKKGGF